jgi:hypothetical protein
MSETEPLELVELGEGVRESLPEIGLISDENVREQVVELHAHALGETPYRRIEAIPASGVPESPLMTGGRTRTTTVAWRRLPSAWPRDLSR